MPLQSPRTPGVRPTTDRVRSALFNILAPLGVEGSVVVDLFAGTGSLGIEALSRGAAHADFVEASARQAEDIRANTVSAKVADRSTVHHLRVEQAFTRLKRRYDLVLMDPPYRDPFPADLVERLAADGLLGPDGLVVVGHPSRVPPPAACGELVQTQDRRYGDSSLAFYRRKPGTEDDRP